MDPIFAPGDLYLGKRDEVMERLNRARAGLGFLVLLIAAIRFQGVRGIGGIMSDWIQSLIFLSLAGFIGTRLVRQLLAAAASGTEPAIFLEGSPGYYQRFGFEAAGSAGFRRPSLRIPEPAFQVHTFASYEPWMTGTLVYPEAFWELDCVGLRLQRLPTSAGVCPSKRWAPRTHIAAEADVRLERRGCGTAVTMPSCSCRRGLTSRVGKGS